MKQWTSTLTSKLPSIQMETSAPQWWMKCAKLWHWNFLRITSVLHTTHLTMDVSHSPPQRNPWNNFYNFFNGQSLKPCWFKLENDVPFEQNAFQTKSSKCRLSRINQAMSQSHFNGSVRTDVNWRHASFIGIISYFCKGRWSQFHWPSSWGRGRKRSSRDLLCHCDLSQCSLKLNFLEWEGISLRNLQANSKIQTSQCVLVDWFKFIGSEINELNLSEGR